MKVFKSLIGDSVVYGLSGVVSSLVSLFLVPIYTSVLQPQEYGILSIMNATVLLSAVFIISGLDNSTATWLLTRSSESDKERVLSSWLFFSLSVGILIGSTFIIFAQPLSRILFHGEVGRDSGLVRLMGAVLIFGSLNKIPNILFRCQRRPVLAITLALLISLVTAAVSIYSVLHLKNGLRGVLFGQIAGNFSGFIFSICVLNGYIKFKYFDKALLLKMLKFSMPLIPVSLLIWGQSSAMSYLLSIFVSKQEIGIYQVAVTFSGVASVATFAFLQAWGPFALSIEKQDGAQEVYAKVFHTYLVLALVAVLMMGSLAKPLFKLLVNSRYISAASLVGFLGLNIFLGGIPQVLSIVNSFVRSNLSILRSYLMSATVTIASFFFYAQFFQKESAVYAMLTGNIVLSFYSYFSSQRLYRIPYDIRFLILLISAGLLSLMLINKIEYLMP